MVRNIAFGNPPGYSTSFQVKYPFFFSPQFWITLYVVLFISACAQTCWTEPLQKTVQQPISFLHYNLPQQFSEISYPAWVKRAYKASAPHWVSHGELPGKTCSSNAFMCAGPDNSTCFQHQISLLIQHQQCYGSRNNIGQPSNFPVPVLKPYENILWDTRNPVQLPKQKYTLSSEMPCIQGISMRLPGMTQDLQQTRAFPEQQAGGTTEHLKWRVTPLSEYTK